MSAAGRRRASVAGPTSVPEAAGATRRARAAGGAKGHAPGATSAAILEAALETFARDGFDGASIPAIARAASIGHPLVHYHFGSKENLWRAAADYAFGDLVGSLEELEQAAAGLEPIEALRLLCRGFARFTARHPSHTLIILNEVRSGGSRLDWLVERWLGPLHHRLDAAIEAAAAAGQIRPVPAAHLASIAVGSVAHFFGAAPLVSRLYGLDVRDPAVVEAHTAWVLEVLMHGLAVPPATAAGS